MSSESGGKQPNLEGNESPHHDHQTETAEETVGHTSTNNEVEARVPSSAVGPKPVTLIEEVPEVEKFPLHYLEKLEEQLGRAKWVVPVRQGDDLEILLKAAIKLCKEGEDVHCEACQRFFRDGLTTSFVRILTDDAVSTWKPDIQRDIYRNCTYLVQLCVAKLSQDWFVLLDLLATLLNPSSRWNTFNSCQPCEDQLGVEDSPDCYSRSIDNKHPKGWMVDLINQFGALGGFQILHDRFVHGENLTVPLIALLIKPFGNCSDYLTDQVYEKHLIPVVDKVISFLNSLSDDALKKEATSEAKSDTFSSIMKSLRHLCRRVPARDDIESFRLKMILRLLQIASFSGKMNALNEINKIIPTVSYHHSHVRSPDDDQLQPDSMAAWIKDNNVLTIVFKDNLHQPQYVDKLDRIVRFCIKEKVLTVEDLDRIWSTQDGKHEIIVKNIHDLLVKLAWDFSPDQLDHLFGCFQRSWVGASKKQRDELLEFIRHLAEDDKEGVMAIKVLELLWNLAHRDDCPIDTMDHALNAHIRILDYSCSQERESQKLHWLQRCVEELTNDKWEIPALKQMKEICMLYLESPVNYVVHRTGHYYYRNEIIHHLDTNYHLLSQICQNLQHYMDRVRDVFKSDSSVDPESLCIDGNFTHTQQIHSRLDFIRFALKDGQLWLGHQQALIIWENLAEKPAFPTDRDACYRWFAKLVSDEPDLEPETAKVIFTENVQRISPYHLSENGFRCFDRFFRMVNINERRLVAWRRGFLTENVDLVGIDYLWKAVMVAPEGIVFKPIELLKDVYTNLSSKLQQDQVHMEFISGCFERLELISGGLIQYKPDEIFQEPAQIQSSYKSEVSKLVRCLTLLKEYVHECDDEYSDERGMPPHGKATWGRSFVLVVRYIPNHPHNTEDFELWTHANECMGTVRRHIMQRLKLSHSNRLELSANNEIFRSTEDKKLVSSIPLRDRMVITAKLVYSNISETSMNSSDNSTDSSEGSPTNHLHVEGPNTYMEKILPSVLISSDPKNIDLLLSLCDIAVKYNLTQLRDTVRSLLKLLPTGLHIFNGLLDHCRQNSELDVNTALESLVKYTCLSSPSKTLYLLETMQSLLMPSVDVREPLSAEFQSNFVLCGGLTYLMNLVTDIDFMLGGDSNLRRSALYAVMKMLKLLLASSAYAVIVQVVYELKQSANDEKHRAATHLQSTVQAILPANEHKLRNTATAIAKQHCEKLLAPKPDVTFIEALQCTAWSSAAGDISLSCDPANIHQAIIQQNVSFSRGLEVDDIQLSKESLEVLCLALAISPHLYGTLQKSQNWKIFVLDILLLTKNRLIRLSAADQLFNMVTKCNTDSAVIVSFITLLFSAVETNVKEHASSSGDFFRLLAKLLSHAQQAGIAIPGVDKLLTVELKWLLDVRVNALNLHQCPVESPLLDGHLCLIVELLLFRSVEERYRIGSHPDGQQLIKKLVNDFLFPASRLIQALKKSEEVVTDSITNSLCTTTDCTLAAFKLLNSLCVGCVQNVRCLQELLMNLFYSDQESPLTEWEYLPYVGPRPSKGFVGLKNAGATCYMNAVLQQLYIIPDIRRGILSLDTPLEDFSEAEKDKVLQESKVDQECNESSSGTDRKTSNCNVLRQVQSIFGHLLQGKLQFHIPKGFWDDFRLWGERVNLREQHDAFEFFNCLVDMLDEGLKEYNHKPVLSQVLGGSFADQKICKGCPHRYSREEPFTALNVDVRYQQHLFGSLDAFVKGDLLEGANAYHCEKCDKKVDTVKRLCIKKLPHILVIQLKRFDYDWEREMAVKFNDYFEFPKEFDMAPYTAARLAKNEESDEEGPKSTIYKLRGIVVHSGQASGGHYYSFIHVKPPGSNVFKWFRFDDGEVVEAKIDDEEEFRAQCFGGEYTGEVYDHVLKKTHYRRQKRWWSAYLLFYDRLDIEIEDEESLQQKCPVPVPIKKTVEKQNLEFLHHKSHFSYPYFQFMRQLLINNYNYIRSKLELQSSNCELGELEELGMLCVKLATKFLFHCGFHTKKTLRGPASEWYDALQPFLLYSPKIRRWFAENVFLLNANRLCEYLLECPSSEIRNMFAKLITFLCYLCNKDQPFEVEIATSTGNEKTLNLFSEITFNHLLKLLKKEVAEHSRHLQQYFQVFLNYASRGPFEKQQLISLGVPSLFIAVSLDEGPGPPMRSTYTDFSKLYAVVGILVRCCDVSKFQRSSIEGGPVQSIVYDDAEPSVPLSNDLHHWLFERTGVQYSTTYVKKVIEDGSTMEETYRFLSYCCWENWNFSVVVIKELLLEVSSVQAYDMRPFLDLLMRILLLSDSWQNHRLVTTLKGIPHHADGLMTIIQHGQSHYQKRAYLCIKFLVNLCSRCQLLHQLLQEDLREPWQYSLQWFHTEMERRPYVSTAYSYAGWPPPAQSNEASNGYFLERSNSAKMIQKLSRELFPIEDAPEESSAENVILPGGDPDAGIPADQADIHGIERTPLKTKCVIAPRVNDSLDQIDDVDPLDNSLSLNHHSD